SKSLKLYLNSFNASRFDDDAQVRERIATDLSRVAGAPVTVVFGLPGFDGAVDAADAGSIDDLPVAIDHYGPPRAEYVVADAANVVAEPLSGALLKSNCPATGQPAWRRVVIAYRGPRTARPGRVGHR